METAILLIWLLILLVIIGTFFYMKQLKVNKWFWICLAIAILGIVLLFVIGYLQKGTFISFDGWRFG